MRGTRAEAVARHDACGGGAPTSASRETRSARRARNATDQSAPIELGITSTGQLERIQKGRPGTSERGRADRRRGVERIGEPVTRPIDRENRVVAARAPRIRYESNAPLNPPGRTAAGCRCRVQELCLPWTRDSANGVSGRTGEQRRCAFASLFPTESSFAVAGRSSVGCAT